MIIKIRQELLGKKARALNLKKLTRELLNSAIDTVVVSVAMETNKLVVRLIDGTRIRLQGVSEGCRHNQTCFSSVT